MIVFEFQLHLLLTLLASVVFPLLVGLVTTRETRSGRKALYLAALSVLTPLLAELAHALATAQVYDLGLALFVAIGNFFIAVGTHYQLWQKTGVTDWVQSHGVTPKHRA